MSEPTAKEFRLLIRNLESAAWAVGGDEYRDGVSHAAMTQRGNELDMAKAKINEPHDTLVARVAELEGVLRELRPYVAERDIPIIDRALNPATEEGERK